MTTTYKHLWNQIKTAPEGEWIVVRVKKAHRIQTIINMVQKTKSSEQTTRAALGLPKYGKLQIKRNEEELLVSFSLKDSGMAL